MERRRRAATACGLIAPTVAVGAILLATVLASAETFTWRAAALSDMGRPGTATFWLFNGGLVIAGVVGIPFVWRAWVGASNSLQRAGTVALAGAIVGMVGVGVFFIDHTDYYLSTDLHATAALTTFGLAPVAALLYGAGSFRAGERRWGSISVGAGLAVIVQWAAWIAYALTIAPETWAWFAVPETLAAALFGGWIVLLARRYRRADERASTAADGDPRIDGDTRA